MNDFTDNSPTTQQFPVCTKLPCAGVTFRFTAIPHYYCRVGAVPCTDSFFFCLHMFTKLFNSDSICYNQCSGTVLGAFFTRAKLLLPRTSFSFVYLFLLSSVCLFLQKTLVYIYSFSLSVYTVFDVSYLLTLLEHKLSCLSGLLIAFCAVPVQHYLISVLITEAQFDFWDLMFTQIFGFAPMISIKHFPEMADESLLHVTLSEFP